LPFSQGFQFIFGHILKPILPHFPGVI
jgi:hypothetical protein